MSERRFSSMLSMSSVARAGLVLMVLVPLWLGVWWALS